MALSYNDHDKKYPAGTHGAMSNTNSTIPASYLAAQVSGGHNINGTNMMPTQRVTDNGLNSIVNQLGGLGIHGHNAMVPPGYVTPEGHYFLGYPPASVPAFTGYGQVPENHSAVYGHPYVHGVAPPMGMPMHLVPVQTGRSGPPERSDTNSHEVPDLENRQCSYSTNSTSESTPDTPFFGGVATRDQTATHVADSERSTYTMPSPQQIANGTAHIPKGFFPVTNVFNTDLEALLKRDPAIPPAVPAVFTPSENMKTLEQSLVNAIPGNRNVYIRGLHPTTDDETLKKYAERFGQVETSKAIICNATGACKGFGFAKFVNMKDSEMCIRGFFQLGYEVGFARVSRFPVSGVAPLRLRTNRAQESFNSRLKAEGDEQSTNLYLSNLPKSMTEMELGAVFLGFNILSSKILRDSLGNSRGVGFARFESRAVCDQIIKDFTGCRLGDEGLALQVRYADTPSQKELKRITSERRQFRTNEYNVGAYGTPLVGMHATIYGQPRFRPAASTRGPNYGYRNGGASRAESSTLEPSSVANVNTATSEGGSEDDEGVTIQVNYPVGKHGSSHTSPVKKAD